MYTALHLLPGASGPTLVAEEPTLERAVAKAKAHLEALNQAHSETVLVVTVWCDAALRAVVVDDADGLAAYSLHPLR